MRPFDFLRPIPLTWTSTLLLAATAVASVPVGSLLESKPPSQPAQDQVQPYHMGAEAHPHAEQ